MKSVCPTPRPQDEKWGSCTDVGGCDDLSADVGGSGLVSERDGEGGEGSPP